MKVFLGIHVDMLPKAIFMGGEAAEGSVEHHPSFFAHQSDVEV